MKRLLILFSLAFGLLLIANAPMLANAQLKAEVFDQYHEKAFGTTYDTGDQKLEDNLPAAVGKIISIVLGLVGVILLIIVVYAGFIWLTAGNSDRVKEAKDWLKNGVIGIVIVLSAYIITQFVVNAIQNSLKGDSTSQANNTAQTTNIKIC